MKITFKLILFFIFITLISCESENQLFRKWKKLTQLYKVYAFPYKDDFVNLLHKFVNESSLQLSNRCKYDLSEFSKQLELETTEAMSMLDSFSSRKSGSSSGRMVDLGNWHLCQSTRLNGLPGKHSLIRPQIPKKINDAVYKLQEKRYNDWSLDQMRWIIFFNYIDLPLGVCLPSTCSNSDIKKLLASQSLAKLTEPVTFQLLEPYSNSSTAYSFVRQLAKVTIFIVILINIICTVARKRIIPSSSRVNMVITSFDLKDNVTSLINVTKSNNSLKFISIVKLFYLISATAIHFVVPIMYYQIYYSVKPFMINIHENTSFRYIMALFSTTMSSNFTIAATLSTLTLIPIMKKVNSSYVYFILLRALRTLPVQLFVILLIIILPDLNFPGTLMEIASYNMSGICFENAWSDIIFTSNFRTMDTMCNRVAWFMSSDMQLFTVSLPLLYYLAKSDDEKRKFNRYLLIILTLIGYISYIPIEDEIVSRFKHMILNPKVFTLEPNKFLQLYFITFNYIPAYLAGILTGYEIYNGFKIQEDKFKLVTLTIVGLNILTLLVPSIIIKFFMQYKWLILALLALTNAFFLSGVILIFWLFNSLNETSIVKRIANNLYIQIINKLSFCFFLIHPFIIVITYTFFDIHFDTYLQVAFTALPFILTLSIFLASLVYLFVEIPFGKLLTNFISRRTIVAQSKTSED